MNIERVVGISVDEIKNLTPERERQLVEHRTHHKLVFSKNRKRGITGRGNPLSARRKLRTEKDLDMKSKKYIGI